MTTLRYFLVIWPFCFLSYLIGFAVAGGFS